MKKKSKDDFLKRISSIHRKSHSNEFTSKLSNTLIKKRSDSLVNSEEEIHSLTREEKLKVHFIIM